MHGKGVMYYKDGTIYDGDWSNGKVCCGTTTPMSIRTSLEHH